MDNRQTVLVSVIMGSDSDLKIMQDTAKILDEFGVPYEMDVISAHRTPERAADFSKNAHLKGVKVIIAAAGLAAHLAGAIAASTPLPVIGVPIAGGALNGVDSLYSTVMMPPGIPVATVAVNGAKNAGLLAIQILACSDRELLEKLISYKKKMGEEVEVKSKKLRESGYKAYLS